MKLYIILGFVTLVLTFSGGAYFVGHHAGKKSCQKQVQDVILERNEKENKLIIELEKARKEREIVYRDKIKIVEKTQDSCLDQPLHPDIKRLYH
jgi:hypothetical protein